MQSRVLNSAAPKISEGNRNEIGESIHSVHAIASVGIAMLNMLEDLLPTAANEVERESQSLSEHFMQLVNSSQVQNRITQELLRRMPDGTLAEEADQAVQRASTAISGITVCMQFQDRNTQIIDNVTSIMERYRSMLEDIRNNIELAHDGYVPTGQTVSQAVEGILSSIRLSDIRTRYLNALNKAKVHSGENPSALVQDGKDHIELF